MSATPPAPAPRYEVGVRALVAGLAHGLDDGTLLESLRRDIAAERTRAALGHHHAPARAQGPRPFPTHRYATGKRSNARVHPRAGKEIHVRDKGRLAELREHLQEVNSYHGLL